MSIAKKLMTVGGKDSLYVDDVFSTYLYTGNNATQDIVNGIDLEGEGGLVWMKARNNDPPHSLYDTERGAGWELSSNSSNASTNRGSTGLTSFNSDGFSIGSFFHNNANPNDYVSWTFRKQPGFFDVVKYSGTATSPTDTSQFQDVPHNLGTTPGMIIVKKLNNDGSLQSWVVNHRAFDGSSRHLKLNSTSQTSFSSNYFGNNLGSGDHSSTFRVVCDEAVNATGDEYIAYLFAHDDSDESMIKCGGYTGNGNNDGPEIDLGFEPQYLLLKDSSSGGDWMIFDNMRGWSPGNNNNRRLYPNLSGPEGGTTDRLLIQANGFKVITSQSPYNENGNTYIYMAIRRPNKPAKEFEPEELFNTGSGVTNADPSFQSNFVADMGIYKFITQVGGNYIQSRMNGNKYQETNSVAVETDASSNTWDWMNGFGEWRTNVAGAHHWSWRRAEGHFDVVAYSGNNATGSYNSFTIPHNLGAVPQMIWVKGRGITAEWVVWAEGFQADTTSEYLFLNSASAKASGTGDNRAFTADPTEDNFTVGPWAKVNGEWDYIAYLFASVPGISKVGSYTGTGATQFIDVGFTNSCRFVLIKRVDAAGDWMVVDTERGFISGMNPYIYLNNNSPQEYTFRVYPYPQGFQLSDDASVNADGGEYLFYAIA